MKSCRCSSCHPSCEAIEQFLLAVETPEETAARKKRVAEVCAKVGAFATAVKAHTERLIIAALMEANDGEQRKDR